MKKVTALLVGFLLLVSSCGTDSDSDSAGETTPTTTSEQQAPVSAPLDELVVTVLATTESESQGHIFSEARVVLPPDGLPFVVYMDYVADPDGRLVAAVKCTDPVCADEVVSTSFDAIGGVSIDIAIDPDGLPAFVLADPPGEVSPPSVRLVRCREPTCVDHTHTEVLPAGPPSLIVPEDDLPLLAMLGDIGDGGPMVVKCSNPACTEHTRTELTELNDPERAAIPWALTPRLGPDGLPALGYTSGQFTDTGWVGDVRVLFCADPACTNTDVVTVAEEPGQSHELFGFEVGPDGPMFGFASAAAPLEGPRFVRCLDPRCSQTGPVSLIGPNQTLHGAAMSVGSDGLPVFAYGPRAADRLDVEIARCADPDCTEGSTATIEPGDLPIRRFMALDEADRPIVVYQRPPSCKLPPGEPVEGVIARCADPACQQGATQTGSWDQESSLREPEPSELEPVAEIMEGWTSVTDETVFGPHGWIGQVLQGGPGLLAIGSDCASDPAGECVTAVWGSVDGTEWERLTSIDAYQFGVTPGGPGFVATSTTCVEPDGPPGCGPIVWNSPNGTDWDQVPIDEDVFPRCAALPQPGVPSSCVHSIDHLVALPDGGLFAAVGGDLSGDTNVAWTSTDGSDWRIVDEAFNPLGADADLLESILATRSGLIATGDACAIERFAIPYFGLGWTDTDRTGLEVGWVDPESPAHDAGMQVGDLVIALDGAPVTDRPSLSRLSEAQQPGDTITMTIVRDGEQLELQGTLGSREEAENFCKAVVATSTDGTEWTPDPLVLQAEGDTVFFSTVEWDGGVAATAEVCDVRDDCDSTLVISPDGVTWQRIAGPDDLWSADLYPFIDGGLLAVRTKHDDKTGQIHNLFLTSPDGTDWTLYTADPELFTVETDISDAIVHNDRLIAVGAATPDGPGGRPHPRVWVYEPPS